MEATALFDFDSTIEDELCFKKGDILTILRANQERNWSKAILYNKVGLVPKTYIRFKPFPGFMGRINRANAEELLGKYPKNHTFLVRESESSHGDFSISVWHEGKVKHAKIIQERDKEQTKFMIIDKRFPTINSLLRYHNERSIMNSEIIKLENPIPDSLTFTVAVSFFARDPSELSITKGSTVTVSDWSDRNWWIGICNERKGMFPVPYVVPMNYPPSWKV